MKSELYIPSFFYYGYEGVELLDVLDLSNEEVTDMAERKMKEVPLGDLTYDFDEIYRGGELGNAIYDMTEGEHKM